MDRGAWRAIVHRGHTGWDTTERLGTHTYRETGTFDEEVMCPLWQCWWLHAAHQATMLMAASIAERGRELQP